MGSVDNRRRIGAWCKLGDGILNENKKGKLKHVGFPSVCCLGTVKGRIEVAEEKLT